MNKDNNNIYQQPGDEDKPKKSKKKWIILGAVGLFVILLVVANVSKAKEEKQAAEESSMIAEATEAVQEATEEELSDAEIQQQALIAEFGEPPAGFRWNDEGEPVAISDENLTGEEVVHQYLRAASMLDLANAAKYAQISMVVNSMNSFYDVDASSSYYTQFSRKMYSEALTSMEILGTEREAVFANGKRIYTMNLRVLDLGYKDFWKDDQEEIFEMLYQYMAIEKDSLKAQQYVYDKILEYYSRDDAKKHDVQVDIVLDKVRLGGWLVTDDMDLDMICRYTDGTSVYEYVMECYTKWLEQKYK